jgi:hypothetical protein
MPKNPQLVTPTATLVLPELLDTSRIAAAFGQSEYTTRKKLRKGLLPGAFKLPGSDRWRMRREDVLALLGGAR